ncbi:hypothetical protein KBB12_02855 [Candidatus Woesebacteria bacterium]|nr:hypothetical protein [Candidatus Woesebacteria bacterium]
MNLLAKCSWRIFGLWYLTLPVAIFFFSWLRTPFNSIFVAITVGVGMKYTLDSFKSKAESKINYRYLALTLGISVIFAILSGAGGFVWQKPDWTKHNVVLNDLINYKWPVYYGPSAYVKDTSLVYYVAYYLPSALVGKILGWRAGELGLFIQSLVGLFIFAQLIGEDIRLSSKKYLLFFLLSGADILGTIILQSWPTQSLHLESYAAGLQFSSTLTQLMWVPQHALAGWIAVMLAYKDYQEGEILKTLPLYVATTFLWSPFISLGLTLVFAPFFISTKIKQYLNAYFLSGILIMTMIFLYYQSQIHVLNDRLKIYLFSNINILNNFGMMFTFLIFDLYIFGIALIFVKEKIHLQDRKLLVWLFVILVLIAQVMYGAANDFVMRVSIPALTLIFVFLLRYIHEIFKKRSIIILLIGFLLVCGMCTPLIEIYQSFHKTDDAVNERPIYPMVNAHLRYKVLHQQYMGLATKAFGRYFGNYSLDNNDEK